MINMISKIYEFYYFVTGTPYFVVYVLSSGNRRIKRFIQRAASTDKGMSEFLIYTPLKSAWAKPDIDSIIIDGLKLLCFVDLSNAIPLKISTESETRTGKLFNYYNTKTTIEMDKEELKDNNGESRKLVSIPMAPTIVYEKIHAHFIKQIMSIPHDKNEWLTYVLIVGLLVFGFIIYMWFNSRGVAPL